MGNLSHSLFQTEITFGAVNLDDFYVAPEEGETKVVNISWSPSYSYIWDETYYPVYNLWVTESGSSEKIGEFSRYQGSSKTLPPKVMDEVVESIRKQPKWKDHGINWEGIDPYEFPEHYDPVKVKDLDTPAENDKSIFAPVEEVSGDLEPEPVVEEPTPEPESEPEPVVVDEEVIETTNDESKVKSDPVNPEMEELKEKLDEQESSYRQLLGMFISQQEEEEDESVTEEKQKDTVISEDSEGHSNMLIAITGTLGALTGLGYYLYNRYK